MTVGNSAGPHLSGTFGQGRRQTGIVLPGHGRECRLLLLQLTFFTAGGFQVPWPAGRIEGEVVFGQ
jgi:hypothetical protein